MRVGKMQRTAFRMTMDFFFVFKPTSEALFEVHYNSKTVGLVGWHSVVFFCQIAVKQTQETHKHRHKTKSIHSSVN